MSEEASPTSDLTDDEQKAARHELIEKLEAVLQDAWRGDIKGVCIITGHENGQANGSIVGLVNCNMLGAHTRCLHRMATILED